jgi:hypothetical protein
MDGWMDGRTDGQTDRQTDRYIDSPENLKLETAIFQCDNISMVSSNIE